MATEYENAFAFAATLHALGDELRITYSDYALAIMADFKLRITELKSKDKDTASALLTIVDNFMHELKGELEDDSGK